MQIKIIADSTCDLSPELLSKYNIRRLPLGIAIGDEVKKDGDEVSTRDILNYVSSGKGTCSTSAINVLEYETAYAEEFAKGADAILDFTISSELSSCYQNAVIAAQKFENVYPIDTRVLSSGGGWLALHAAELAAAGNTPEEIVAICERKKRHSDTSFVIDTLDYLHKGGRCSGLAAFSANILNLKPCLNLRDGKIIVGKKYHGQIQKSLRKYLRDRIEDRTDLDMKRAFITHTFMEDLSFVEECVEMLKELQPFEEILVTEAGCTVFNHCGPNTLGVLFYTSN